MDARRIRQIADLVIVVTIVLGSVYYLPRLSALGRRLDAEYAQTFLLLGLIPWSGSLGMILPCLSFFTPPLPMHRRVALGIVCAIPLALALRGITDGHPDSETAFIRLGFLCSLGVWCFALPAVLFNVPFYQLIAPMFGKPVSRRRTAPRP